MTLYLDANATTPPDPRVTQSMLLCLKECVGNAGSPHAYGRRAKLLTHHARDQIGACVGARRHEVIFTSGATESNNLALFGMASFAERNGRCHIVSTQIEHRAVLEPLQELSQRGFDVTLVPPGSDGQVAAKDVLDAVREDTLLVSVMQVNNETGVWQPLNEIADLLSDGPYLHVDAAQGFGKANGMLRHQRIDLVSISGHKIHGPQGIGALVARRRNGELPPLRPLMYGGGQEFGLRPGTLPIPLVVGFGTAAELAEQEAEQRRACCARLRTIVLERFSSLGARIHGDPKKTLPHVLNLSFPGWDADEVIEALDGIAAVSDGSACTSVCATASHVLEAMKVETKWIDGAIRISWSHLTPEAELERAANAMRDVLGSRASK